MDDLWFSLSIAGMVALLVAFAANRRKYWSQDDLKYLWCNAFGAGVLAAYSWRIDQPVFVVLEAAWCADAVVALVRRGIQNCA